MTTAELREEIEIIVNATEHVQREHGLTWEASSMVVQNALLSDIARSLGIMS